MRAWDRDQPGGKQPDIAAALGATQGAVSPWLTAARSGGREALLARLGRGTKPQRAPAPLRLIPDFLGQGAGADGVRGDVGTGDRVVDVLAAAFGVAASTSPLSRRLKRRGETPPLPLTCVLPRDDEALERGRVASWPALPERPPPERRTLVFGDEAGFCRRPAVVQTSGPPGETPVLDEGPTHDPGSVLGGLRPPGPVALRVGPTSLPGRPRLAFVLPLGRRGGDRLGVIGAGSPIPRRAEVKAFLAAAGAAIRRAPWPPSAPDGNPVQGRWRPRKAVARGHRRGRDRAQWPREFPRALGRVRQRPHLFRPFFADAGLEV